MVNRNKPLENENKHAVYHTPVLLKDCIQALQIDEQGTYVDVTFGGGGHSSEMLKKLAAGKLLAFDMDPDAAANKIDDARFILIRSNFNRLEEVLKKNRISGINGLLADLGVSSHQFDTAGRGFSTRFDAALDMRMDTASNLPTAAEILSSYSDAELKRVFREFGELRNAGSIVNRIRQSQRIRTVNELKEALMALAPRGKENRFFAQVFQALRIEVNDELGALKALLKQATQALKPGGRLVVISYHSLEDRLVKHYFRSGNFTGEQEKDVYGNVLAPLKAVNRQPILPDEKEIERNPRARSAKLRIAEKIA